MGTDHFRLWELVAKSFLAAHLPDGIDARTTVAAQVATPLGSKRFAVTEASSRPWAGAPCTALKQRRTGTASPKGKAGCGAYHGAPASCSGRRARHSDRGSC